MEACKKNVNYESFETANYLLGAANNFLQIIPLKKLSRA